MSKIPDTRIEPFNFKDSIWNKRTNAQRAVILAIPIIAVLGLTFLGLSMANIGPFPKWDHSVQNWLSTDVGSVVFIAIVPLMVVGSTLGMYAWCEGSKREKEKDASGLEKLLDL